MWSTEGRCLNMDLKNMSNCVLQRLHVGTWEVFHQGFKMPMKIDTKFIIITWSKIWEIMLNNYKTVLWTDLGNSSTKRIAKIFIMIN